MRLRIIFLVFLSFSTLYASRNTQQFENAVQTSRGSSRALMVHRMQPWQGFMQGKSGCIRVVANAAVCGFKMIGAGFKCVWSLVKCIIPKCKKCCAKFLWRKWCVPCKCSWNCSTKRCKKVFKKTARSCKIATDDCVKAFNGLGKATKRFFHNVGRELAKLGSAIKHAAEWVARKAWEAIKWIYDMIMKFLDLIKFFQVAKSIGQAFKCFGKLGSKHHIKQASRNARHVKNVAQQGGKRGIISKIDSLIPGFKPFVCCMQKTAIGRVLNKWGKSLKTFHKKWKGLKVGSLLDDPALVVSLAAEVASGVAVGTSLDIAISTAFNIGLYWTFCTGFKTNISAGVAVVVNLFRKFSLVEGKAIAITFEVEIPETPIGIGAGVLLPIDEGIDFGAVNVEVGAGEGISPVSIGGSVCEAKKLIEFNLLELLGNILTANNECPQKIPQGKHEIWPTPSPTRKPATGGHAGNGRLTWGAYHTANWWGSLDRKGWSKCSHGYALTGLWRNRRGCNGVHCIEQGACRKPSRGSFSRCYQHNVWHAFDKKGLTSCNRNYFLAGLWKNSCDKIYCLEWFWCCTVPNSHYAFGARKQNWWGSFDKKGWSSVPTHTWITGLWRNSCYWIYCIEEAYYSQPRVALPPALPKLNWGPYHTANWWGSLDRKGWSKCSHGYALTGLWRNRRGCNGVHCIEQGACRKPSRGSFSSCYQHNVWHAFDKKGLTSCKTNFYLAGLWKNSCDKIYCLEWFWCCTVPGTRYAVKPRKANWWGSFDRKGWSSVPAHQWITGLWRNSCYWIYCIEEAYYAQPAGNVPAPPAKRWRVANWGHAINANWWSSFDRRGWSKCPHGYAITGFWRNSCHHLYCLESAMCRKSNIGSFTHCYQHNVWSAFDRKGNTSCNGNFYLSGLWRNTCNKIYCIEYFWCCTIPGSRYQIRPKAANWWSSFDRKGWSSVPGHNWITGLWRNNCTKLYCIEMAYYARPKKYMRRRRLGAPVTQNQDAIGTQVSGTPKFDTQMFGYSSPEHMANEILTEYKEKLQRNLEKEIRENNRRLEEMEREEAFEGMSERRRRKDPNSGQPVMKKKIPIDNDMCGPRNIEAEIALMEAHNWVRKSKKQIVKKLCTRKCLKKNIDAEICQDARTAACYHKFLGGDLDTVKECCQAVKKNPEHLVFRVRRFCAKAGGFQKPSKKKFCRCAKSNASTFGKYDCINTVLDGCGSKKLRKGAGKICLELKKAMTPEQFAQIANRIFGSAKVCNRSIVERVKDFITGGDEENNMMKHMTATKMSYSLSGIVLIFGGIAWIWKTRRTNGSHTYEDLL